MSFYLNFEYLNISQCYFSAYLHSYSGVVQYYQSWQRGLGVSLYLIQNNY